MSLAVEGLVVEAPNGARLLDGVGFVVPAGSMLAVAGPTGAGKTTLAQGLTGAVPVVSGAIVVGGRDVTSVDTSRRGIGYVPQSDALHPELSVQATLEYAAALRMPGQGANERHARIDDVLDKTRLAAQTGQVVVALSVGQRKRVSIAIELLSMPEVLVLDEPTSSLDPGYEASVMATLRELAERGHAIVVVTHSQSVIAGCDRVVLLTSGGRLAYFGGPQRMHEPFGTATAGELFTALDLAAPEVLPGHPSMSRLALAGHGAAVGGDTGARRRDARRQFPILARRYVDLIFADRRRSALFAIQGVVLGGLLMAFVEPAGLARPTSNPSYAAPVSATGMAVLLVMCMTWLGMSNSVREIVKERHILVREHRAGLSSGAYVASKIAVLGPLLAAEAAIVTVLAVVRQHVPGTGAVLPSGVAELMVAMSLAGISAVALGLFVSAVVRSNDRALAVLPMIVVVEFVLSGLTPSVSWLPGLAHVRDLAGTHWAVAAISATVTGDSQGWLVAVGALLGLSTAALGGALIVVRRSLRLPVSQRAGRAAVGRTRNVTTRLNPEMLRLSGLGAGCLAGIAVVLAGLRLVVPVNPATGPAAAAVVVPHVSAAGVVTDQLPGLLGEVWWVWRTGTQLELAATEAAYVRSSIS